jgi:2-carboxy-D-arabinitol-1-phosphatase
VEYKKLELLWAQSKDAWQALLNELPNDNTTSDGVLVAVGHPATHLALILLNELPNDNTTSDGVLVAVGHPATHLALICRCLNLQMEYMSSFHVMNLDKSPLNPRGTASSMAAAAP